MSNKHHFPCSQCGSDLRFSPEKELLQCDHCGAQEQMEQTDHQGTALEEIDFYSALSAQGENADGEAHETRETVDCPSCGARFELAEHKQACECPFCASPVVTAPKATETLTPKALLPFVLSEPEAHKAMNNWLGKLWFAPSGLQDYARKGRKMDGIYVPYWTYDAQTRSEYWGQRGDTYYETRTVTRDGESHEQRVERTRWRHRHGHVARFFDDVLVLASKSMPKKYTDALQPWDLSELEAYSPKYLAGFNAESYQISLEAGFTDARAQMDRIIARDVRSDIGGDKQRIDRVNTQVSEVTFKHILLPVWMAAYKYRGKTYRFVVNGSSGRVQGERPYSIWKIALAVSFGLLIAATFAYIATQQ